MGQDEQDSWKRVRFMRHLPKFTAEEESEMEALNPKSSEELKEEQEEREFRMGASLHSVKTTRPKIEITILALLSLALLPTLWPSLTVAKNV